MLESKHERLVTMCVRDATTAAAVCFERISDEVCKPISRQRQLSHREPAGGEKISQSSWGGRVRGAESRSEDWGVDSRRPMSSVILLTDRGSARRIGSLIQYSSSRTASDRMSGRQLALNIVPTSALAIPCSSRTAFSQILPRNLPHLANVPLPVHVWLLAYLVAHAFRSEQPTGDAWPLPPDVVEQDLQRYDYDDILNPFYA